MNIRELIEAGLAGALTKPLIKPIANRIARKSAEKEIEKDAGAAVVPRVKAQAQAVAKTQDKEKPQVVTGIIFGRFNPPHKGHKAAWQMASKCPYWYVGTNESTQGPKDPLPYDIKVKAMSTVWPGIKGHLVAETSWLTLASHCFNKHKDSTTLICFTDEDWVTKTIQQYNGVKGAHGFYKFDEIKQQPTPRLSSATALRSAVQSGDRDAFTKAAGISSETPVAGSPYFDLVAYYLKQFPEPVKRTKSVSEERMSAQVKLQRAWEREQAKSTASRERAEKAKAEFEKEWKAKQEKEKSVDEGKWGVAKSPQPYHKNWTKELTKDQLDAIAGPRYNKDKKDKKAPSLSKDEVHERFLDNLTNALLDEAKQPGKGGMKAIDKSAKGAMKNASTLPALNMSTGSGGAYMNYRMSIALAGAPNFPTKMEADNWIGGDPLLSTYTDEEFEMIKAAAKQVGAGTIQNWSGNRSKEVADVNKTSTTAKIKRNKYGV